MEKLGASFQEIFDGRNRYCPGVVITLPVIGSWRHNYEVGCSKGKIFVMISIMVFLELYHHIHVLDT